MSRTVLRTVAARPRYWLRLAQAYWLLLQSWTRGRAFPALVLSNNDQIEPEAALPLTEKQRQEISEEVWLIDIASRHPYSWAVCLQRSLALFWWLKARGVHSHVRLGARKQGAQLDAHAWVEYRGEVLNDSPHTPALFATLRLLKPEEKFSAPDGGAK